MRPVQFIVNVESKVLVGVHSLHFLPLDDGWGRGCPLPPIIHHHLMGLTDVELQVVAVVPCDKVLYQSSVLLVTVITDASNDGGIVRKLL